MGDAKPFLHLCAFNVIKLTQWFVAHGETPGLEALSPVKSAVWTNGLNRLYHL